MLRAGRCKSASRFPAPYNPKPEKSNPQKAAQAISPALANLVCSVAMRSATSIRRRSDRGNAKKAAGIRKVAQPARLMSSHAPACKARTSVLTPWVCPAALLATPVTACAPWAIISQAVFERLITKKEMVDAVLTFSLTTGGAMLPECIHANTATVQA